MCLQKGHFSYFIQSWIRTTYASVLKSSGKVPWFMKVPWHVRLFYKSAHHLSGISTLPHFPTPQKQFPCSKHIYYVDIGWLLTKVRLILYNLLSKMYKYPLTYIYIICPSPPLQKISVSYWRRSFQSEFSQLSKTCAARQLVRWKLCSGQH